MRPFLVIALLGVADAAEPPHGGWHLLPEPRFMGHALAWPIPASDTAVLVPARRGEGEPILLDKQAVAAAPDLTRAAILDAARVNAQALLDRMTPQFVRDSRGVILYAVLASKDPFTASVVLAPGFAVRFRETIGPDPLVAMPNRFMVIVFPRAAVPAGLSDLVFAEYGATNHPVSREVFDPRGGTLRAVADTR